MCNFRYCGDISKLEKGIGWRFEVYKFCVFIYEAFYVFRISGIRIPDANRKITFTYLIEKSSCSTVKIVECDYVVTRLQEGKTYQ